MKNRFPTQTKLNEFFSSSNQRGGTWMYGTMRGRLFPQKGKGILGGFLKGIVKAGLKNAKSMVKNVAKNAIVPALESGKEFVKEEGKKVLKKGVQEAIKTLQETTGTKISQKDLKNLIQAKKGPKSNKKGKPVLKSKRQPRTTAGKKQKGGLRFQKNLKKKTVTHTVFDN